MTNDLGGGGGVRTRFEEIRGVPPVDPTGVVGVLQRHAFICVCCCLVAVISRWRFDQRTLAGHGLAGHVATGKRRSGNLSSRANAVGTTVGTTVRVPSTWRVFEICPVYRQKSQNGSDKVTIHEL